MAKSHKRSTPTWYDAAEPSPQHFDAWRNGQGRAKLEWLGERWDAVAVAPARFALDALTGMRLSPRTGYPVIGDRARDTVYVMVHPGSAGEAISLPSVRVLGRGHLLLVPDAVRVACPHGTPCAHWISAPRTNRYERLVRGRVLADHLHQLSTNYRKATTS
jgi:hypothetical protein